MAKSKKSKQKKAVSKSMKKPAAMKKKPLKNAKSKVAKSAQMKKAAPQKTVARVAKKASVKVPAIKTSTKTVPQKQTKNYKNFLSPLENRLFLKLLEQPQTTTTGLYLPATAQRADGFIRGEVLAVGPGRKDRFGKLHRVGVVVGETVMLTEHAGTAVIMEGQNFIFVRESDILGVVE